MPDNAIPQPHTNEEDPGANTEMFRAFVEEESPGQPQQRLSTKTLAIIAGVIVLIAVVAAIAVF
jgi:hypothetical protein